MEKVNLQVQEYGGCNMMQLQEYDFSFDIVDNDRLTFWQVNKSDIRPVCDDCDYDIQIGKEDGVVYMWCVCKNKWRVDISITKMN